MKLMSIWELRVREVEMTLARGANMFFRKCSEFVILATFMTIVFGYIFFLYYVYEGNYYMSLYSLVCSLIATTINKMM